MVKKWLFILLLWIVAVFLIHYYLDSYLKQHLTTLKIVSFIRTSSGIYIFYRLLLKEKLKNIFD